MSNISDDEDMLAAMDKSSPIRPPKRSWRAYDDDDNGEGTQDEAPNATGSPDGTLASNSLSDATVLPSSELARLLSMPTQCRLLNSMRRR